MRFKDKSVIITGGGGKIAKAYALAFAGGEIIPARYHQRGPYRQSDQGYGRHRHQYGLQRSQ
jgi:NAD(P)-dependent dehydrogenase (short-subunit alcohol dehydrogenase family)